MMNEEMNLISLQHTNIDHCVHIVRSSFDPLYLTASIYRAHGISKFIAAELENPCSPYDYKLMENGNGQILNFCEFKRFGDTAFLNIIATASDIKSAGAGRAMFEACRTYYREQGLKYIMLDVFESNTVAYNWYLKLGFTAEDHSYLQELDASFTLPQTARVINNYPQYRALTDGLGFGFIEYGDYTNSWRAGVIGNDLICRDREPDFAGLLTLKEKLGFSNIYLLNKDKQDNAFLKDKTIRLKLTI